MKKSISLWQFATTGGVLKRSLLVAVVVGSILNLINQTDALVGKTDIDWFKLALTYAVPYFVSMYGAVSARLSAQIDASNGM